MSYRLDQALALSAIGAFGAGIYSVAGTIALLPSTVGLAIASATFQQVVVQHERGDRRPDGTIIRVSLLAGAGTAVLLAIVTPVVVPLVFGEDFSPAIAVTWIGLVGSLFFVGTQAASSILIARGRGWHLTAAQMIGLAVGISLVFAVAPPFGAVGLAVAWNTGFLTTFVITARATGLAAGEFIPTGSDVAQTARVLLSGSLSSAKNPSVD